MSGTPGVEVDSIVSLSAIFFIFPFENSSVSSFSPDDRKWASGAILEAAAAAVETGAFYFFVLLAD